MTDFLKTTDLPSGKRVLIAPLDWGLGHATRCVPVIKALLNTGHIPIVAAYGSPLNFYRSEYPELEIIELLGLSVNYPKRFPIMLKMAAIFPMIVWSFIKEHKELKRIVDKHNIDVVISDGRFGLWNRKVKSIFINHQINIKLLGIFSVFEYPLFQLNRIAMSRFNEVWIPDIKEKPNLAGNLSAKYILSNRYKYIGPLSRFEKPEKQSIDFSSDILIILSGPEPARTEFEKVIFEKIKMIADKNIIIVRGKPGYNNQPSDFNEKVTIKNHLTLHDFANAIINTKLVISRPGYSTIMDLSKFGKKALFVPTPGQSEQEYLAKYYQQIGWAPYQSQHDFKLENVFDVVKKYSGIPNVLNEFQLPAY